MTIPINDILERKRFVLAAYNLGQGRVAYAQQLALHAGKDPTNWDEVKVFLEAAKATKKEARDGRKYVPEVLKNEAEFVLKSTADKKVKNKRPGKVEGPCTKGHWITKDDRPIFICD